MSEPTSSIYQHNREVLAAGVLCPECPKGEFSIEKPECELGYTQAQLDRMFPSENRRNEFNKWMYGQTSAICEGRRYNHEKKCYEESEGGVAHGMVVYAHDVRRFLAGLPVID